MQRHLFVVLTFVVETVLELLPLTSGLSYGSTASRSLHSGSASGTFRGGAPGGGGGGGSGYYPRSNGYSSYGGYSPSSGSPDELQKETKYYYGGKYQGSCVTDGLYYRDDTTFIICSNGYPHEQPCPPGTKTSGSPRYQPGYYYGYTDLCSVNLVDYGYAPEYYAPRGYSDVEEGHPRYASRGYGDRRPASGKGSYASQVSGFERPGSYGSSDIHYPGGLHASPKKTRLHESSVRSGFRDGKKDSPSNYHRQPPAHLAFAGEKNRFPDVGPKTSNSNRYRSLPASDLTRRDSLQPLPKSPYVGLLDKKYH